jgi:superfamily II DNA/RNA helicase
VKRPVDDLEGPTKITGWKNHRYGSLPRPDFGQPEHVFDLLSTAKFRSFENNQRTGQLLFRIVLEKALFSSPDAARHTIAQRLKKIASSNSPDAAADRQTLQELDASLAAVDANRFTKYRRLVKILSPDGALRWNSANPEDRLVIFTERLETLDFLRRNLARDLNLTKEQIAAVHGSGISEDELTTIIEDFGRRQSPIRLLLATDIASEGLNLHYLSHKLIHFDAPWSLMVFQQRNGRIDRYGQERIPHIVYLMTKSANEDIRGDLRILELLTQKDEEATG